MAGRKLDGVQRQRQRRGDRVLAGEASFENVSGDTTLRITTAKVEVNSVSGDVHLSGGLTGDVEMESVSGNIELGAKALDRLEVNTCPATPRCAPACARAARQGGDAERRAALTMPRGTGARVHVETFSGDISGPACTSSTRNTARASRSTRSSATAAATSTWRAFSGDVRISFE
jgi:DUF4097 and DUF4098 domain-containing protein YvlB